MLISPTPIRPLSPAKSPTRDQADEVMVLEPHMGADQCGEVDGEMELGLEIFEIFRGSAPCCPSVYSTPFAVPPVVEMRPPSRNQNPLIKDQRFFGSGSAVDRDSITSTAFSSSLCEDIMRMNFAYSHSAQFTRRHEVVVGSA
mmetsp:Transcript_25652/g.52272  ORF Transcript_25652/g.52272 Transcript_25652/m.52272 type:complete len:143 (+) Transcript_25652:257-685(+)